MKVFVTGATGALGAATVEALLSVGHDVGALAGSADEAALLVSRGVTSVRVDPFHAPSLADALVGYGAVCNLASAAPVGYGALRRRSWREHERIRSVGALAVAGAALAADVTTVVQESVSLVYADAGDEWIDEDSPIAITAATEPVSVAEAAILADVDPSRRRVVLRFGMLVGDDATTRWRLRRARAGGPVAIGRADAWTHVVHPVDAASAVVSALTAGSGTYNVGSEPLLRRELVATIGRSAGRDRIAHFSRLALIVAGDHLEPYARSHRVSSDRLTAETGWKPRYPAVSDEWFAWVQGA